MSWVTDDGIDRLSKMAVVVRRDQHKTKAFVSFRKTSSEQNWHDHEILRLDLCSKSVRLSHAGF